MHRQKGKEETGDRDRTRDDNEKKIGRKEYTSTVAVTEPANNILRFIRRYMYHKRDTANNVFSATGNQLNHRHVLGVTLNITTYSGSH